MEQGVFYACVDNAVGSRTWWNQHVVFGQGTHKCSEG